MSNYLSNLVARNLSGLEVIQPRLPSLFEPIQGVSGLIPVPEFGIEKQIVNSPVEEFKQTEVSGQMNSDISAVSQPSTEPSTISAQQMPKISQRTMPMPPSLEDTQLVSPIYQSLDDSASNSSPLISGSEPVQPTTIFGRLSATDHEANTPVAPVNQEQRTIPEPLSVQPIVTEHTVIEQVVPAEKPSFPERLIKNAPVTNILSPIIDPSNNPVANILSPIINPSNNPVANILSPIIDSSIEQPVQNPAKPASMPEERPILRPVTEQVAIPHQVIPALRSLGLEPQKSSTPPQPVPTIQVTIGRIEVRATPPTTPSPVQSRSAQSVMSLEEYLRQRGGGR